LPVVYRVNRPFVHYDTFLNSVLLQTKVEDFYDVNIDLVQPKVSGDVQDRTTSVRDLFRLLAHPRIEDVKGRQHFVDRAKMMSQHISRAVLLYGPANIARYFLGCLIASPVAERRMLLHSTLVEGSETYHILTLVYKPLVKNKPVVALSLSNEPLPPNIPLEQLNLDLEVKKELGRSKIKNTQLVMYNFDHTNPTEPSANMKGRSLAKEITVHSGQPMFPGDISEQIIEDFDSLKEVKQPGPEFNVNHKWYEIKPEIFVNKKEDLARSTSIKGVAKNDPLTMGLVDQLMPSEDHGKGLGAIYDPINAMRYLVSFIF